MNSYGFASMRNASSLSLKDVALLDEKEFHDGIAHLLKEGARLISLFGSESAKPARRELWAVVGRDSTGTMLIARRPLVGSKYPSLTVEFPQAHLFEREVWEQYGITPEGHPWLKPVRFPRAPLADVDGYTAGRIGDIPYYSVQGEEIHEVGVGPVHAGVIEPGHFRFQCYGEQVLHLEISLGYQHRGVEEALLGGPHKYSIHQIGTSAGDTTIGHAWAYVLNLEALSGTQPPARADVIRAVALELERLANHTGDLGALAGDVGFLPTMSFCGRLRGDFLNMSALLCGNRFGRGLMTPGGVRFDLDDGLRTELLSWITKAFGDVKGAAALLWDSPSVTARFENTGVLTESQCRELGLVGVAARACGLERDVRINYPWGPYRFFAIPPAATPGGDVYARAFTRWLEIKRSVDFIKTLLERIPGGEILSPPQTLPPNHVAVSLTEGWRGEIAHTAITDGKGRFSRYKIVDPSFHNWFGLALALRGQQISDFPLCNKSFNLSYCGVDL